PARLWQYQNGKTLPDKTHAQGHDNGRQIAEVDQRTYPGIYDYPAQQQDRAQQGRLVQPGRDNTAAKTDEGADRKIELAASDDEHLRRGGQCDRQRQAEHQVKAEIAHGARIDPGDRDDHQGQREGRQQAAQQTDRTSHQAGPWKESWMIFSSLTSAPASSATMPPAWKT